MNALRSEAEQRVRDRKLADIENDIREKLPKQDIGNDYMAMFSDANVAVNQDVQAKALSKLNKMDLKDLVDKELDSMKPADMNWNMTGKEFYELLSKRTGSPANASAMLKAQGVTGNRYLDQGSRVAGGSDTSNFVVFPGNEDLLTIKEINDNPVGGLLGQAKSALPNDYYELNSMATQAYADLRANPSQETSDFYKSIMKARDEAPNNPSNNYTPPVADIVDEGYKGQHLAPTKDGGAPLWDMKGVYPDDFYSGQGAQYYGDGADPARDAMIVSQMQSMKGRPNAEVTIYRAVPKSVPTKEALNTGDWITLDRKYAKEHGEGALNGDYKIISKTVRARDLFTNGDSIYEMGYDPQPRISTRKTNLLD
jgi:hypothetical protein